MQSLASYFTRQTDIAAAARGQLRVTAMCASHTTIVFGFSNGVLVMYDAAKAQIVYTHKVSRTSTLTAAEHGERPQSYRQPQARGLLHRSQLARYFPQIAAREEADALLAGGRSALLLPVP